MLSNKSITIAFATLFLTGLVFTGSALAFNLTYLGNGATPVDGAVLTVDLSNSSDPYLLPTDASSLFITPTGKSFSGWDLYIPPNETSPNTTEISVSNLTQDVRVGANWSDSVPPSSSDPPVTPTPTPTPTSDPVTEYNVTYDYGVVDSNSPYAPGDTVTVMPKPTASVSGYSFEGWTTDDLKTSPDDPRIKMDPGTIFIMPEGNVTFSAYYEEHALGDLLEIIFDPKVPEYSTYGRDIVYQNFPQKDPVKAYAFTFPDGRSNEIAWIEDDPLVGRWTLQAEYAENLYYSLGNKTPADPVRPGYRFHGWYLINNSTGTDDPITGDTPYDFINRPVNDHTYLSALWWKGVYNITYLDNGKDVGADYPTNPKKYTYTDPKVTLVKPMDKPGYGGEDGSCPCDDFYNATDSSARRWLLQNTTEVINIVPQDLVVRGLGDVVLVADYSPCEYRLAYYWLNGSEWEQFDDLNPETFNSSVPKRLPFGTEQVIIDVLGEDFDFKGWYSDTEMLSGPHVMTPVITKDNEEICTFDYYMKVEAKPYNITYHLGADDAVNDPSNPATYTALSNFGLGPATRPGHFFGGWLLDNIEGQYVSTITGSLKPLLTINGTTHYRDIDLYAVWTDKMFRIIYMDVDIKNSLSLHDTDGILKGPFFERTDLSPKTYDVSRNDTKLPIPDAPINQPANVGGFDFLGWYLDEMWTIPIANTNATGQYVATNGIMGDITVYAKWKFAGDGWGIITYIPKNGENACEPGDPIWQEVVYDGTYAKNYDNYHNAIKQPGDLPMTRVTEDGRVFEFVGWNLAEPYERDGYCARVSQTIGCGAECAYNFNKSVVNENITLGGSWKLISIPEPPKPTDPCPTDPCVPSVTPPAGSGLIFTDVDGNAVYTGTLNDDGTIPDVPPLNVRYFVFLDWVVRGFEDGPGPSGYPEDAYLDPVLIPVPSLIGSDGDKPRIGDVLALLQVTSGIGGPLADKTTDDLIAMGADLNRDNQVDLTDVLLMLENI